MVSGTIVAIIVIVVVTTIGLLSFEPAPTRSAMISMPLSPSENNKTAPKPDVFNQRQGGAGLFLPKVRKQEF